MTEASGSMHFVDLGKMNMTGLTSQGHSSTRLISRPKAEIVLYLPVHQRSFMDKIADYERKAFLKILPFNDLLNSRRL